jgi:hypothetical protein
MALTVHQSSVPVFVQSLTGVINSIDKLTSFAAAAKIDPSLFLSERLYPNMFNYGRQVQQMCYWAANTTAWLAGKEPPKYANDESTLDALKARVQSCIDYVQSVSADDVNAGETREIIYPAAGMQRRMRGDDFLLHQALPQFYFHVTTAYAILRSRGVELGKRDFMGPIPRMVQF